VRFLTITGHVLGKPRPIARRQREFDEVYRALFGKPEPKSEIDLGFGTRTLTICSPPPTEPQSA
jgi:hypothetical protein